MNKELFCCIESMCFTQKGSLSHDRCSPSLSKSFVPQIPKVPFNFLMIAKFSPFTNGIIEYLFSKVSFMEVCIIHPLGHQLFIIKILFTTYHRKCTDEFRKNKITFYRQQYFDVGVRILARTRKFAYPP